MRIGVAAALLAGLCGAAQATQATQATQASQASQVDWQISVTQQALDGRALARPAAIACRPRGCEAPVTLLVGDRHRRFLAGFTFVQRGAYLTLQALDPGLGHVIGFTDGFEGPIFIAVRGATSDQLLRFTLSGVADGGAAAPALMDNTHSLVFHRKLHPDLTLFIHLRRPRPMG